MSINYLKGDATDPKTPGNKIIAHVCNDVGKWGKGFVLAVSRRWPQPEQRYRAYFKETFINVNDDLLGKSLMVPVSDDIVVANMIAQNGIAYNKTCEPPIRYWAVENCLLKVNSYALNWDGASVHMPRIGCGLAGGKWSEIEAILTRVFTSTDVYVYDL